MELQTKLNNYTQALFQLSDVIKGLNGKYNIPEIIELTNLDLQFIRKLVALGGMVDRSHNLLPEFYIEVMGLTPEDKKKYLTLSVKNKLTPCKLRKEIRKANKKIKDKSKPIQTTKFSKYIKQLDSEMRRMTPEEKKRAKTLLSTL